MGGEDMGAKIAAGLALMAERRVNVDVAVRALKTQNTSIPDDVLRTIAVPLEVLLVAEMSPPYDRVSVAKDMVAKSGAFPWDGPVGNGLTLSYYRGRFLEMADERLFFGRQIGMIPAEVE